MNNLRKISANLIVTGEGNLLKNGIICIDDTGKITDVIDTKGHLRETQNVEFYNGVIVPGFVNAHCHLELSGMKNKIKKQTGLPGFIAQIGQMRHDVDDTEHSVIQADKEMQREGIVAVGDISNTTDTIEVKLSSEILYQNFIELYSSSKLTDEANFQNGLQVAKQFNRANLSASIVPHAPYSVQPDLYRQIRAFNPDKAIISIHNQETESENDLFLSQTGEIMQFLKMIGFKYDKFQFSGQTSLKSYLPYLNKFNNILLIHNTFTDEFDIDFAEDYSPNIYWTFCPSANLYIENKLPDIALFYQKNVKICIGTDSYASNTQLSILEELKIIQNHFPEIPFLKLIEFASLQGAKALKIDAEIGSFEIGKTPGVNLISDFDFQNMKLTDKSRVRNLLAD